MRIYRGPLARQRQRIDRAMWWWLVAGTILAVLLALLERCSS